MSFPINPTNGQQTTVNGTLYTYNSTLTAWTVTAGGNQAINIAGNIQTASNVLASGIMSATGNIITDEYFVGNFAGNITGNLTVPGSNTQVLFNANGNAGAAAGFTYNSGSNTMTVLGVVSSQGNVIGGNVTTAGIVSAAGNVTGSYIFGNGSQLTGIAASSYGDSNVVTLLSNLGSNTVSTTGNVTGSYIFGNGSQLTGIATSSYGDSNVVTLLSNLGSNTVSTTGNVSGGYIFGNGSQLTGIAASSYGNANVVANLAALSSNPVSTTGNVTAGNLITSGIVSAGNFVGAGAGTPTITSSANLDLSVVGAVRVSGSVSATANVTGNYIFGNGSQLTGIATSSYGDSNVVTLLSNLGANAVSTTGNVTGSYIFGNGSQLTGIATSSYGDANVVTLLSNLGANAVSTTGTVTAGNVTGGNLATGGNVTITGAGRLVAEGIYRTNYSFSSLALNDGSEYFSGTTRIVVFSGTGGTVYMPNVGGGSATTALQEYCFINRCSGTISVRYGIGGGNIGSIPTGATGVITASAANVTSASDWALSVGFNGSTVSVTGNVTGNYFIGTATSAQYADIAENYTSDNNYEPGTVLEFGGSAEVTLATDETPRVAGVVSTLPAHLMNSMLTGEHTVAVALLGRVPCKVQGPVAKGDMLISAGGGYARAKQNPITGTVIGKALEALPGNHGVIEVVVGRL